MPLQNFLANTVILRARRAGMADKRFEKRFNSWHPFVQRTWRASGGAAYHGNTEDDISSGWHAGNPTGSRQANAQRASDEAWARERQDRKMNKILYQRDTGRPAPPEYGSISPEYIPPEERAEIAANQAKETARAAEMQRAGASQRTGQPIEAGRIGDRGVRVVGPHMVEYALPGGGTAAFTTMQNGKLVDAHQYLMNKPGFTPNPEYFKVRGAAQEAAAGLPPVDTSKVVPGAGGDYLSRGGVMTPVENLGAADRTKYDTGSPLQRIADAFTTSPAAVAVRNGVGNAMTALGNMWNRGGQAGAATGADTEAGVSRAQAARIQTPTQAEPVPKTETSPEKDINSGKSGNAPVGPKADPFGGGPSSGFQLYKTGTNIPAGTTGTDRQGNALFPEAAPPPPTPLPEDWQNRRFAYEGL